MNPSISPDTLGQLSPGPLFSPRHPWPRYLQPVLFPFHNLVCPSPLPFLSSSSSFPPLQSFVSCYSVAFVSLLTSTLQSISNVCRFLDPFVKMKFNSAIALSSLLALAVAQDSSSTTSAATTTASLSPQASCATKCKFLSPLQFCNERIFPTFWSLSSILAANPNGLHPLHVFHLAQQ